MTSELRKMKKFRFQLLCEWIVEYFSPCKVADIGGGKGLLTYLLKESGFESMVIDPFDQALPLKYKDLQGIKHKIPKEEIVRRVQKDFETDMARYYDLLIGLHAHGSNMKIIEASAKYNTNFILLSCCVIDEPIEKKPDIDWFVSLEGYARKLGHKTKRFELNFGGQNVGFSAMNRPEFVQK